jgi:hypothetical protein
METPVVLIIAVAPGLGCFALGFGIVVISADTSRHFRIGAK